MVCRLAAVAELGIYLYPEEAAGRAEELDVEQNIVGENMAAEVACEGGGNVQEAALAEEQEEKEEEEENEQEAGSDVDWGSSDAEAEMSPTVPAAPSRVEGSDTYTFAPARPLTSPACPKRRKVQGKTPRRIHARYGP